MEKVWLNSPVHKNQLKFKFDEDESILDTISLSFDGSILAVDKSCVESLYKTEEVDMVRLGYKKMPEIKVDDKESFYRFLSYMITI
jgi:hypothetical protein|tara:strand:- start:350 stop:607 length:258 start_codon:yes stop_codon:yes gene_type:complete